jgi:hypothetical protein
MGWLGMDGIRCSASEVRASAGSATDLPVGLRLWAVGSLGILAACGGGTTPGNDGWSSGGVPETSASMGGSTLSMGGSAMVDGSSGTSAGGTAPWLESCQWPQSLDSPDAGACRAKRAFVQCSLPSGGTSFYLSDDPTQCPSCGPDGGATCQNECAADEYAAACGSIPPLEGAPPVSENPPDGCHMVLPTPAGIAFYCCPCQ